eukprot:g75964.t1
MSLVKSSYEEFTCLDYGQEYWNRKADDNCVVYRASRTDQHVQYSRHQTFFFKALVEQKRVWQRGNAMPLWSIIAGFAKLTASEGLHAEMAPTNHKEGHVLYAKEQQAGTVIFLHGYDESADSERTGASVEPITPGKEAERHPAWFDLLVRIEHRGSHDPIWDDATGIRQSRYWLQQFILEEVKKSEKIVLFGFDQGGALALFTGLTTPIPEVVALINTAGWLPLYSYVTKELISKPLPILLQYGRADPVVLPQVGWAAKKKLTNFRDWKAVIYNEYYSRTHEITDSMVEDIVDFLQKIFRKRVPKDPQPDSDETAEKHVEEGESATVTDSEPVMCTQDVKTCPDGTFLARDPDLQCAFPACPEVAPHATTHSTHTEL